MSVIITATFPKSNDSRKILNAPYKVPSTEPSSIEYKKAIDCWAKVNSTKSPCHLNNLESFERELSLPIYCIAHILPSMITSPV